MFGSTACRDSVLLYVAIIFTGYIQFELNCEDDFGNAPCKRLATRRGASLYNDGPPLRRTCQVQRPLNRIELPLMIEFMHSAQVVVLSGFLVFNAGAVFPAVPQTLNDIDEFAGDLLTAIVIDHLAPEIFGSLRQCRRDDVPARAAAAEMIERRKLPCDIEGFAIGGGGGADETDVCRSTGEC